MPDPDSSRLFYVHVPKASGTTLYTILRRQYGAAAIVTVGFRTLPVKVFRQWAAADFAPVRVVRGHVPLDVRDAIPGPVQTITILREPAARVISHYYFLRRNPDLPGQEAIRTGAISLREFVSTGAAWLVDNGQTRLLCGLPGQAHVPFGACTREMLDAAKHHLRETITVAGLSEQFDASALLMQRALGWRLPLYVRRNVTPGSKQREAVTDDTRQLIAEHNALDLELYAYAQDLFAARIAAQGTAFATALRRYQALNRLYGVLAPPAMRGVNWLRARRT